MQQKSIIIALIVLTGIIFSGAGFFAGTKMSKKSLPQGALTNAENTYQSGWDAAMKTLNESGAIPQAPQGTEVKNISGTVQSVSGNDIVIKVTTPGLISTPALSTRTVTVDANTKIVQLVQKDPVQLQKEMDAYNEKMKKQQTEPTSDPNSMPYPVEMQDKKDASVGDIKVGQLIAVQTAEDIKDKQQFMATEIQIQQDISTPPVASAPSAISETNVPPVVSADSTMPSTPKLPPVSQNLPVPMPAPPAIK